MCLEEDRLLCEPPSLEVKHFNNKNMAAWKMTQDLLCASFMAQEGTRCSLTSPNWSAITMEMWGYMIKNEFNRLQININFSPKFFNAPDRVS